MLRWTYDSEADAAYFYLSEKPYHHGVALDDRRRIDYAEDGTPIGVEILGVRSLDVDVCGLPAAANILQVLVTYAVAGKAVLIGSGQIDVREPFPLPSPQTQLVAA